MSLDQPKPLTIEAEGLRFGIVAARFNERLVDSLLANLIDTLKSADVDEEDIEVLRVPGSYELPYAVKRMADSDQYDCIVALGLVIAGDTTHHEMIAQTTGHAFMNVAMDSGIPVINGVITVDTQEQAEARCGDEINRGREFGQAALEMAQLATFFDEDSLNDEDDIEPWPYVDEDDDQ